MVSPDRATAAPIQAPTGAEPIPPPRIKTLAAAGRIPVDRIHDQVRAWIIDGTLEPGAPISQVKLAASLGVGRTPLREALRMLQREGLIEGEYNHRVRVVRLSILDLEELYALRLVQEAIAIRLTVPHLTAVEFDELDELLQQMERLQKTDYEAWETVHRTFHARLVMHAGTQLSASLSRLVDHTGRYRKALLEAAPMSYDIGAREHVAIVEACHAGDAERSGQLLARHLARTALTLISLLRPEHDPLAVREALRVVLGNEDSFPFRSNSECVGDVHLGGASGCTDKSFARPL